MNPKVTLITVVFNNAAGIEKCIESVISQDYDNIEYIVIDGASTDGTQDVIARYREHINVYISEPDGGIYDAMNKGLAFATSDIIAFLNSDDHYFPDAVSASVSNILESGCDLSYAGFYYADDNNYAMIADEARAWDESMFVQGIPGGHETIFARRECYDQVGFHDLSYRLAADYHWVMRVFEAGFTAAPLNMIILVMATGGTSFNEALELSENRRLLEERFGAIPDSLLEKLYKLKFYQNWHGSQLDDRQMIEVVAESGKHSERLGDAVMKTVENRKRELKGNITPNLDTTGGGKKIAVFLTFLSGINGGAERIAIEQANELHARGHAVTVVCCHGLADKSYYKLHSDIPYIDISIHPYKGFYERRFGNLEVKFKDWSGHNFDELNYTPLQNDFKKWLDDGHEWRAKMYAAFLMEHTFDIAIGHMPSTYPYMLLFEREIHKKQPQLRFVSALHNAPKFKFYSELYPADNQMDRYMRIATLYQSDRIGVLFENFIPQMPESLRDRCVVIPNFTTHTTRDVPEGSRNKLIISVGRLTVQKNQETLLRAFAKLHAEYPGWALKIYGSGPLETPLRQLAQELGLDDSEIFQGSRANLTECYEEASIFAFPSLYEGFGLVLVEAMAAGLPCIGFSDCEGVNNIIEDHKNGLLVSADDRAERLFEGLKTLVEAPSMRRDMGRMAHETVPRYSLNKAVDQLESILDALTSKPAEKAHSVSSVQKVLRTDQPLRTLILTSYTVGGAGIAAMRLHQAMLDYGHDSHVMSFSPSSEAALYTTYLTREEYAVQCTQHPILAPQNRTPGAALFSPGVSGISHEHFEFMQQFDVINIHWVAQILPYDAVAQLASLGTPIVWTLHDMNPFTGGCHYSSSCEGYLSSCRNCPQLNETFDDFPDTVLQMKTTNWPSSMAVVSPSRWLAGEARRSAVFRKNPVSTIPNSLDLDVFRPSDRVMAKLRFGLPLDQHILLFASFDNNERRKGFPEMIDTIRRVHDMGHNIHIVSMGSANSEIESLSCPYTVVGHLDDPETIAALYSAADVTVLPTLEDNLPNVILESSACGTPVAAFSSGGVADAVIPGVNGALAEPGDCDGLAHAIVSLWEGELRLLCRQFAETQFRPQLQAERYTELFNRLLDSAADEIPNTEGIQELRQIQVAKENTLARTLIRAESDVEYLKNLCEDLRAQLHQALNDETQEVASPDRLEGPSDQANPDVRAVEIQNYENSGFINFCVSSGNTALFSRQELYFKLWRSQAGVGLEFRERDGAFELLEAIDPSAIQEDKWGPFLRFDFQEENQELPLPISMFSPVFIECLAKLPRALAQSDAVGEQSQDWIRHTEYLNKVLCTARLK